MTFFFCDFHKITNLDLEVSGVNIIFRMVINRVHLSTLFFRKCCLMISILSQLRRYIKRFIYYEPLRNKEKA